MAVAGLRIVHLEARGRAVFVCDTCHARQEGDIGTATVADGTGMDPTSALEWLGAVQARCNARSSLMPVGWGSYYNPAGDKHKCPSCVNKEYKGE